MGHGLGCVARVTGDYFEPMSVHVRVTCRKLAVAYFLCAIIGQVSIDLKIKKIKKMCTYIQCAVSALIVF